MKKKLDKDLADGEISCTKLPTQLYVHMMEQYGIAAEVYITSSRYRHVELRVNDGSRDKVFMVYLEHESGDSLAANYVSIDIFLLSWIIVVRWNLKSTLTPNGKVGLPKTEMFRKNV